MLNSALLVSVSDDLVNQLCFTSRLEADTAGIHWQKIYSMCVYEKIE